MRDFLNSKLEVGNFVVMLGGRFGRHMVVAEIVRERYDQSTNLHDLTLHFLTRTANFGRKTMLSNFGLEMVKIPEFKLPEGWKEELADAKVRYNNARKSQRRELRDAKNRVASRV